MSRRPDRCDLAPPTNIVLASRSVLGSIDLDPYSTKEINTLVQSAKIFDRNDGEDALHKIISQDWIVPGEGRVFVGPPTGLAPSRKLFNKTLREYRKGSVQQAILWVGHNETMIKCPWLWDFPCCMPFKRLRPSWWDDELETFRSISPSDWSAIFYLPPSSPPSQFQTMVARFHTAFSHIGRIVFNELSGEGDWELSYKSVEKKPYNYRE